MGGSGCGKTLLLRTLAGRPLNSKQFIPSGTVTINNGLFYRSGEWHRKIGFVQRNDELYPKLTVRETILYAVRLKVKLHPTDRVDDILKLWKIDHLANVFIEDIDNEMLSVGNRKRVAIAVHTVHYPNVLFLDEPTVGFDPRREEALIEDLKLFAQSTNSIVILTINPIRVNIYDH